MKFCNVFKKVKNKMKKNLGRKIKEIRKEQNLSQSQLAFESGLSREHILRIEKGNENATVETLAALSVVMNVPVKKFFEF